MLKNQRDLLSILLGVLVLPAVWILQGLSIITLPGEVIGASIAIETLIAQFYFRKATGEINGAG